MTHAFTLRFIYARHFLLQKKGNATIITEVQDQLPSDDLLNTKDIQFENGSTSTGRNHDCVPFSLCSIKDKLELNQQSAIILLCSVPCHAISKEIHAIIIIEILDGKREIWKADFNPTPDGNKICQKGKIEINQMAIGNDEEITNSEGFSKLNTPQMSVKLWWKVNLDTAEKFIDLIKEEEAKQGVNYSLVGESFESSVHRRLRPSDGYFHNCITWARRVLKKAKLDVDEKVLLKSWRLTMIYEK